MGVRTPNFQPAIDCSVYQLKSLSPLPGAPPMHLLLFDLFFPIVLFISAVLLTATFSKRYKKYVLPEMVSAKIGEKMRELQEGRLAGEMREQ